MTGGQPCTQEQRKVDTLAKLAAPAADVWVATAADAAGASAPIWCRCRPGPAPFRPLPATTSWQHRRARFGFRGRRLPGPERWPRTDGTSAAIEEPRPGL
jgi:hypothetical protein